jgi:hypothetical protein
MGPCAVEAVRHLADRRCVRRSPALSRNPEGTVPVLILAAEFDDRTPIEYGRQIASGFRSSHVYEIPGRTHGWTLGKCEDDLVRQFVANPRARLDASCVAQEVGTIFETRGLELQRFVFTITDSDASRGVAGEWEAWVPGPQIVTTVELRVTGDSVAGTIVQPRNKTAISEGRFERGTLFFKATVANGERMLTLCGTIAGDEIRAPFQRLVIPAINCGTTDP